MISAVNGAAVGWGMELALFADIRIASERAKFAELFIKRPRVRCRRILSIATDCRPAAAAELLFTGDVITAAEALRVGLVSRVVEHDDSGVRPPTLRRASPATRRRRCAT
jgi:enoyl-CoA hydratase/carnithine racemase